MISDYDSDDCDIDDNINDDIICDFIDDETTEPVRPASPDDPEGSYKVGPLDIPEGMIEQAIRFSLPLEAISWDRKHIFKLAYLYNKKFNVHKYIWSYETKNKGESEYNPHLHAYLILPLQKKSTKSDFINKVLSPFIRRDCEGRLMHKLEPEVLKLRNYQAYIIKDGNYIHNLEDKEIENIEKYKKEIIENMNKKTRHKLLEKIKLLNDKNPVENIWDLNTLSDIIINIYIFDWDMEPPLHKIKSQALYVGRKLNMKLAMSEKILFWQ